MSYPCVHIFFHKGAKKSTLKKWQHLLKVLGKLDNHTEKNEIGFLSHSLHKNWTEDEQKAYIWSLRR